MNSLSSDPSRTDVLLWLREAMRVLDGMEARGGEGWPMRVELYRLARLFDLEASTITTAPFRGSSLRPPKTP